LTGKSAAPVVSAVDSVPRNYYKVISENKDVTRGMMMLSVCVQSVKTYVAKVLSDLNHFSFLYLDDKEKFVEVSDLYWTFHASVELPEFVAQCVEWSHINKMMDMEFHIYSDLIDLYLNR